MHIRDSVICCCNNSSEFLTEIDEVFEQISREEEMYMEKKMKNKISVAQKINIYLYIHSIYLFSSSMYRSSDRCMESHQITNRNSIGIVSNDSSIRMTHDVNS